jgi:hypothetical protein
MKDEVNTEIRNKVLNSKITPEMLSTVREIDLYTAAKREEMIAKSRRFMAQNTLEVRNQDEEHEIDIETIKEEKQQKQIQ